MLSTKCSSILRHTKPGGWVEFIDLDLAWQSPDGSLKQEHASLKFNNEFINAMRKADMEPCPGPLLEGWVKDAGFSDVHHEKYVLPIGTWPADKHLVGKILYFPITLKLVPLFANLYLLLSNRKKLVPGTTFR